MHIYEGVNEREAALLPEWSFSMRKLHSLRWLTLACYRARHANHVDLRINIYFSILFILHCSALGISFTAAMSPEDDSGKLSLKPI